MTAVVHTPSFLKAHTMKKLFLSLTCLAALVASNADFRLVNRTGYDINEVYVGPTSSSVWGEDVMGEQSLDDGETANIRFTGKSSECMWDIKVVYEDKDQSEFRSVNLCETSVVTIFWNRKTGESRFTTE
jgi:hypothetical protein